MIENECNWQSINDTKIEINIHYSVGIIRAKLDPSGVTHRREDSFKLILSGISIRAGVRMCIVWIIR
ncbi:MAG: hypothetical protein DRP15_03435 [Candidatus Aenigmatarchaeota archaeon]|nr:MAG: hypothetical protein DRP15_03435 [Candidatus Aenigmarchaeota archaeon]